MQPIQLLSLFVKDHSSLMNCAYSLKIFVLWSGLAVSNPLTRLMFLLLHNNSSFMNYAFMPPFSTPVVFYSFFLFHYRNRKWNITSDTIRFCLQNRQRCNNNNNVCSFVKVYGTYLFEQRYYKL